MIGLDTFMAAYIKTMLWSTVATTEDNGDERTYASLGYTRASLAPECLAKLTKDCESFLEANAADIGAEYEKAGHDFWLTRERHGAGFWDGDWEKQAGIRLTAAAHAYGGFELHIGDDKRIHAQ